MSTFPYTLDTDTRAKLGLIVLQSDESVEDDFRRMMPPDVSLMVSRVPSALEVTSASLAQMEHHMAASAALFPRGAKFDAVGYACTSGAAQIGPGRVAQGVREGTTTRAVTEPVSALVAACRAAGLTRLAFLSPYIESVSGRLRSVLDEAGVATPVFGTFDEAEEAKVVRINGASIKAAARDLVAGQDVQGLFLSCTNLRTLDIIKPLEAELGLPVLSSNLVLAWHMLRLVGAVDDATTPSALINGPV